jgi:hypothetical protein
LQEFRCADYAIRCGIKKYPQDVSYQTKVNNGALMIRLFFRQKEEGLQRPYPDIEQSVLHWSASMSR